MLYPHVTAALSNYIYIIIYIWIFPYYIYGIYTWDCTGYIYIWIINHGSQVGCTSEYSVCFLNIKLMAPKEMQCI